MDFRYAGLGSFDESTKCVTNTPNKTLAVFIVLYDVC